MGVWRNGGLGFFGSRVKWEFGEMELWVCLGVADAHASTDARVWCYQGRVRSEVSSESMTRPNSR
eukprot:3600872-Rhodomonas_salina.2